MLLEEVSEGYLKFGYDDRLGSLVQEIQQDLREWGFEPKSRS